MRQFLTLVVHELRMLLIAPSTYVAAVLFLLLMGLVYFICMGLLVESDRETPTELYFKVFFLPVLFMVPLLTMKSIADEKRQGTLEALRTTPVTVTSMVLAKFFSAYFFYVALWALSLGFPLIFFYGLPPQPSLKLLIDPAILGGGMTFIALSGAFYVAVGLFTSSLTRSQLVAGMLSFGLLFVLIVIGWLLLPALDNFDYTWLGHIELLLDYLQTYEHLEDFSRGVIDTRPFFFYLSGAAVTLGVTMLVVEARS
ncbi:MAG: ABC transporter permease [Opitutales bacterium]